MYTYVCHRKVVTGIEIETCKQWLSPRNVISQNKRRGQPDAYVNVRISG